MVRLQLVYIVSVVYSAYCANILFIAPLASPSHYLWNKVLALQLVTNGHNVTMLTHDLEKNEIDENYTVITIEGFYEHLYTTFNIAEVVVQESVVKTIFENMKFIKFSCDYDLKSTAFQKLLNYPQDFNFDLVIFDITAPICLYGFISRFDNPPVIGVSAFSLPPHLSHTFGNPMYTSYTPYFSTTYTNKMNFVQRTLNFIYTYFDVLLYNYISLPYQHKIASNAFELSLPYLTEALKNISLFLVNIDPVLDYPIPLLPSIIPVGGLQIKPPNCLSRDLEHVFDNSEHGVIFFSLGTNVHSSVLTNKDVNTFLHVFSKLKQVVIWKYDGNIENVPKNVIIKKWVSQNDILGHPKTKLFITHCGGLSTQETIYHGVPVVGIPYFIDQNANMAKLVDKQVGVYLSNKKFTFEHIYGAIMDVLNNPMYAANVKNISERFKNQMNSPLERAVFWIEYVLQYGKPDHLNVPSRDMSLYQTSNLDVLVLLLLFLIVFCCIIYLVLFACLKKFKIF